MILAHTCPRCTGRAADRSFGKKAFLTLLDSVTLHSSYFTVDKHIKESKWSISFWEHHACGVADPRVEKVCAVGSGEKDPSGQGVKDVSGQNVREEGLPRTRGEGCQRT